MADISKIKTADGTTYNIKDSTARANSGVTGVKGNAESSYRTGNVNLTAENVGAFEKRAYDSGTTEAGIRPFINQARANRLAFLPADQIIIEKTTDGGETWVDAGYTDSQKLSVFSETGGSIQIPLLNNAKSTLCGVRITISGMKYNVPSGTAENNKYSYWSEANINKTERYFNVREWWFWVSANNDTIRPQIYCATGKNPNNWVTVFNTDFGMTGWSGSDWIRAGDGKTFGGSITQTGNYWNWRLIFWSRILDGKSSFQSATAQTISQIRCYGDSVWTPPNNLMSKDHLYSWDSAMNATFPAKVTATSFSGNVTGNLTGNASGTAANVTGTVAINHGGTGKTTANDAANNLISGLPAWTANPTDDTYFVRQDTGGTSTFGRVKFSTLWNYIKGKFSGTSPITFSNGTIGINTASTSAYGATKLSTDTNSTATDVAATPSAVRAAYNLASNAVQSDNLATAVSDLDKKYFVLYINGSSAALLTSAGDPAGFQNFAAFAMFGLESLYIQTLNNPSSLMQANTRLFTLTAVDMTTASAEMVSIDDGVIFKVSLQDTGNGMVGTVSTDEYLTSETDPIFTASAAHGITSGNITAWNGAVTTANNALSGVMGTLIYDHTYTISNGVAIFTPHVYCKGKEVTSNYAASCFTWKYRLINGSEVSLTTKSDRGCNVTITDLGYGGHVIGTFTPPAS